MKRYIFHVQCKEIWVCATEADDDNEAWNKIRQRDYFKLHTIEGETPSGKTELVGVQDLGPAK